MVALLRTSVGFPWSFQASVGKSFFPVLPCVCGSVFLYTFLVLLTVSQLYILLAICMGIFSIIELCPNLSLWFLPEFLEHRVLLFPVAIRDGL